MPSNKSHTWLELPPNSTVDPAYQNALNDSLRQIALQLDQANASTTRAGGGATAGGASAGGTASGGAATVGALTGGDASALLPSDPRYRARWVDATGSPHTDIWFQVTLSGTLPQTITVYYNAGDGNGWQYMGSFSVTAAGQTFYMPGGWWVPTQANETWQLAAVAGALPGGGAVAALPTGAVQSATFTVAEVGAINPDEFTLAFQENSSGSLYDFAGPFNPGYYTWRFHDLAVTFPAADVNLWDLDFTVQEGYVSGGKFTAAADATGTERQFCSMAALMGWESAQPAMGTTVNINGPTAPVNGVQVPDWTFQANTTNWVVRVRVYAVSRLGNTPAGGNGTRTLLTGWAGSADHFDLTPGAPPAALNPGNLVGTITASQISSLTAAQITGTITASQISSLTAPQITGTITATQIASVSAGSIAGVITSGQIGSVSATTITGVIVSSQLVSQIINSANLIATSGVFANGIVNNGSTVGISASGMTSGSWTAAQIASVNSSSLVGLIVAGQINTIATTQLTGQVTSTQISSVAASAITGSITSGQIGSVAASAITGSITSGQIGSVAASAITGSITSGQIGSVSASTITIGLVGPSQISSINASQLNAGTIAVGSGGMTFSGSGGIIIAGGGGINVNPGSIVAGSLAALVATYGWTISGGSGASISYNSSGATINATQYQIAGTQIVNSSGTFVGAGVNCPSYGIGGAGFNPTVGGVQYYGATFTFQDLAGTTHTVKGGVLVS